MKSILLACGALLPLAARATAQGIYTLWQDTGSAAYDAFGQSLLGLGDVDGDGLADFLVGAPQPGPGGTAPGPGYVEVISGGTGAVLYTLTGTDGGLGASAARVGDLTGDGVTDFVVGEPFATVGGTANVGQAKVFSGSDGAPLQTLSGAAAEQWFGSSVAGIGDVDGDGVPDILVGSPTVFPLGSQPPGYANVFSGATGAQLASLTGVGPFAVFGTSADGVGDVNFDGVPDYVVGAPQGASPTAPLVGSATVFSGSNASILWTFYGPAFGCRFGESVAGPGDVNGDGAGDILVGAPWFSPTALQSDAGIAQLFSGGPGSLLLAVPGMISGESQGSYVGGVGDFNGGGSLDLLVGSSIQARVFFTEFGFASETSFGYAEIGAAVGDTDGDGQADLLLALPSFPSPVLAGAGVARVVSTFGIPPGSAEFGAGCPGSGAFVPVLRCLGGAPTLGSNLFGVVGTRVLGGADAWLLVGSSSTSWNGIPLPANLAGLGLPACSLEVVPDVILPALSLGTGPGTGRIFANLPVPLVPGLAGQSVFVQWYVADPGPALLPGAMSQALQILIL